MKRILFIIGILDSGGVAKSIVNLLNAIDCTNREIHLLKMSAAEGPFSRYIPQDVSIHHIPETGWLLDGWNGIKQLLLHRHLLLALGSLMRILLSRIDKPLAGWLLSQLFPALPGEWDTIVDYNGQQDLYYMVDKLTAKRKITFFHNDYHKWRYYERMDRRYFKKVDKIYTISEQCVQSLKEIFPEDEGKIGLMYNISLPKMISKMAEESISIPVHKGALLVTVGHVCERKGIDFAIEAAHILNEEGVDFLWLWIGANNDARYEKLIKKMGLHHKLLFLGVRSNPYPYIKNADIVVHPSRYEGKSMTLDEAKILCKPIVVTHFSTVRDQFEDGINACICEMSAESIAGSIVKLLENNNLANKYMASLRLNLPEMDSMTQNLIDTLIE